MTLLADRRVLELHHHLPHRGAAGWTSQLGAARERVLDRRTHSRGEVRRMKLRVERRTRGENVRAAGEVSV